MTVLAKSLTLRFPREQAGSRFIHIRAAVFDRYYPLMYTAAIGVIMLFVALYVVAVNMSFLDGQRLQALERQTKEETEKLEKLRRQVIDLASPEHIRAAAEARAMVEVSEIAFVRSDAPVAVLSNANQP